MRYETIVEYTKDGRAMLRLVIVPDDCPPLPEVEHDDSRGVVIINPTEEDPYVIDSWNV